MSAPRLPDAVGDMGARRLQRAVAGALLLVVLLAACCLVLIWRVERTPAGDGAAATTVRAPAAGVVEEVAVSTGQRVERGAALVRLGAAEEGER